MQPVGAPALGPALLLLEALLCPQTLPLHSARTWPDAQNTDMTRTQFLPLGLVRETSK